MKTTVLDNLKHISTGACIGIPTILLTYLLRYLHLLKYSFYAVLAIVFFWCIGVLFDNIKNSP
jgi:hypothetical protein